MNKASVKSKFLSQGMIGGLRNAFLKAHIFTRYRRSPTAAPFFIRVHMCNKISSQVKFYEFN